ncbi:eukaryotic translation initiation factor 4 gamma 1-like isoform X2 [Gouania willdenowi]|uniref:eukaryotic translation initiation factor 4 gamma 1-like isoform X2 n=1 Tax=Gouania willdenowi TaxID=441366 RepID=UPI001055CC27|nr:eukaryotic translation initiation factor 4 gamma 1-like isoform X2 [Gouania willdenowi]
MINPAQQQPQAPPPQQPPTQPQGPPKRERKRITIRDPNQGGRDITEEIMSGRWSTPTPTPPQTYDQNKPTMAANDPRVQVSSGPPVVEPTDFYPTSSPMKMISQQQLPFAGYPQGYFIPPEQYWDPYMPPIQQYPVTTGSTGFYPGTIPAEYPGYGAYYPEQPQYPQYDQPTPVMINPAQQQPQAPPPQLPPTQPRGPPKRERKRITIRDPNQGGRDITEEIMSGRCYNPTPTPPQTYDQNKPTMAANDPRVQVSSGPPVVEPTDFYPTSSPMRMISQQQVPFAGYPQGYFIPPGQYWDPYMPPIQQYPVTTGSAGFYPGTIPAEYPGYAGAYYPEQPQYPKYDQPTPVMINPAQQQPQAPPPQLPPTQPRGPPKRERKRITIRDPNQGGRDITEEIMSGRWSTPTPTPPQTYDQNEPTMAANDPRVQVSSGPPVVEPTDFYPTSSPMRMISQQQLPFAGYPQGYFIPPEQYWDPYMPPIQQYPVTTGSAGFYPGTIPAEYPGYGAYYPEQPQYPQYVQPTPVMINPAQQQPQAPPPQQPPTQPQGPPKRERKRITIRDPNQGGRDITEEIMSGRWSTSTPTPPQTYDQNEPTMAANDPRVQVSSGPPLVEPTDFYPTSSPMRMISQQQLPFAGYPQGYFIPPGQYWDPYMPPIQQYPVTTGSAGFYPGTIPAEYPGYAGAYYPEQPQYPRYDQPTPVMINPAQQQPQAPPPQQPPAQPQGPPKRERKRITIRDPNQGGLDITEEIMSGKWYTPTPAPRQTSLGDISPPQTNGEVLPQVTALTSKDENAEFPTSCETPPPPPATAEPVLMKEAKQDMNDQIEMPADFTTQLPIASIEEPAPLLEDPQMPSPPPGEVSSSAPVEALSEVPVSASVCDTVVALVRPFESLSTQETAMQDEEVVAASVEKVKKDDLITEELKNETCVEPVAEVDLTVAPVNVGEEEIETKTEASTPPSSLLEPDAPQLQESDPISPVKHAEPALSNGFPQESEDFSEDMKLTDTKSHNKPDNSQTQEPSTMAKTAPLADQEEQQPRKEKESKKSEEVPPTAVGCPEEPTMQDENAEFPTSCETPPTPPATAEPVLMKEAKQDMDDQIEMPADFTTQLPIASIEEPAPLLEDPQTPSPPPGEVSSSAPVEALNEVPVGASVCDTVVAIVRPSESL